MKVCALVGGSGAGKSLIGRELRRLNYPVIDCDRLVRDLQKDGSACVKAIAAEFPQAVSAQLVLDRKKLAEICFSDAMKKKRLNQTVHPFVVRAVEKILHQHKKEKIKICFLEAPALFESGLNRICDEIVLVTAPMELRTQRIMRRDGLTQEEALLRINAQIPDEELRIRCSFMVNNDGTNSLSELTNSILNHITKESEGNMNEKTEMQLLEEKILKQKKNCFQRFAGSEERLNDADMFAQGYMSFLDNAKTEREAVTIAIETMWSNGFRQFVDGETYKPGDGVFFCNRGKNAIGVRIGKRPLSDGLRITAAHVDSPRLDLKPHPLYESDGLGFFKTHYYGGVKKYQWVTIPLAMHGVVVRKDGSTVEISVGEKEGDPVFCISDLLPHLSRKLQNDRKASEALSGEELNVLIGNRPIDAPEIKEPIKLAVMKALYEQFGFVEDDFSSAEIEFVPAFKASFIGFDRAMIGAYGHDDRVCAYASFAAFCEVEDPEYTTLMVFADKEETGSDGVSGLHSDLLRSFITRLCANQNCRPELAIANSKALSADVSAAFDPTFASVYEKNNASMLNCGVSIEKYTGSGGKGGTSEAGAEYVAWIRALLDGADIPWQADELGKIDEGGGGTVAKFIAGMGIDVIDVGVPLLSMHAPFEVCGIYDLFSLYLMCKEFFKGLC